MTQSQYQTGEIISEMYVRKLRTIVSSIGFREDTEVATLVLRELCVEGLQQGPDIRGSSDGACDIVRSVGESSSYWLIDVKHIGVGVEAVWVERGSRCPIDKMTRAVLCCIPLGQYFPLEGGAREPRDNGSGLPICRNKEIMGQP